MKLEDLKEGSTYSYKGAVYPELVGKRVEYVGQAYEGSQSIICKCLQYGSDYMIMPESLEVV